MLIFTDGFDYYPTADILKKWSSTSNDAYSVAPSIVLQGRYGTNTGAVQMGSAGNAGLYKSLNNANSVVVGFAFKSNNPSPGQLITLASSNNNLAQANIVLSSGTLSYQNGIRNSYSANSNTSIVPNTWYYIEFKTTFKASALASETQVRINGVVVIDVPAGTNTIGDSIYNSTYAVRLQLCGSGNYASNNIVTLIDDFYLCDSSGSTNNNFLGDVRIETLFPSGPGDSTQFTPTSGANWTCVSETPEDGDASYVAANTPGLLDLYQLADLSSNPTAIYGLQISTIARKNDVGNRLISPVLNSGGTNYDHSATNPFGLADGYTQHLDIWETDPNGNVAWTGQSVNALELGVKVTS